MKLSSNTNMEGCRCHLQILLALLLTVAAFAKVDRSEGKLRGRTVSKTRLDSVRDLSLLVAPTEGAMLEAGDAPWNMTVKAPSELTLAQESMSDYEYIPEPEADQAATLYMDPDVVRKFKAAHSLQESVDLPMQRITADNTFLANGKVFSLDGLTSFNVFAPGATYMEDGVDVATLPAGATFFKMEGEDTVLVTPNPYMSDMRSIDIIHADGSVTYMEEVAEGVMATVIPQARDRNSLTKFVMAHREVGEDGYVDDDMESNPEVDESKHDWTRKLLVVESAKAGTDNKRKLQSGCSSLLVIEVAIAYESSYCSALGGSSNANAAVQQIVARASTLYQNNFCTKIEISHLEGFCSSGSDPYRAGVLLNSSGCDGSGGLLGFFSNFWSSNRGSVTRDAAHLFSATGLECNSDGSCVIGCATSPSLCSGSSSYGVNYITFDNDSQLQANLFAHELGHNAGSSHDATTSSFEYIMEPSINSGANGFSQPSRNAIANYLNSRSCISTAPASPAPPSPTAAPAPPAPPPAPPSSAPCSCSSCTASVLNSIADGYRCIDRINWVITTQGMGQLDACALVSGEFPSICGPGCDPNQCQGGSGNVGRSGEVRSVFDSTACMDLNTDTSNVQASTCNGSDRQGWIYDPNTQRIMTAFNPDYCLDWNLASNNLMVFQCHSGSNQKWTVDGGGRIKSLRDSNACVDLHLENANLYMNTCHTESNQSFTVPSGFL